MRKRKWGWDSAARQFCIAALLLVHLLWMILGRSASNRWQHLLSIMATPSKVASAKWRQWRDYRWQRVTNLRQAQNEINELRAQIARLLVERDEQVPKIAENDEAIRLLGLKKMLPLNFQAARVITDIHQEPFGGIIIDKGHDAHLTQDQGIINPEGVVGRVWDVEATQSSVLPIGAYNASTGVMLARSRATGTLQGTGNGTAVIHHVSNQEVVQIGESVFTSGLDRIFPRGLLVGYVSAVKSNNAELYIQVNLAVKLNHVLLVLILPPYPKLELGAPPTPNPTRPSQSYRTD